MTIVLTTLTKDYHVRQIFFGGGLNFAFQSLVYTQKNQKNCMINTLFLTDS